jgi:hypothetical protein
VNANKEHPNFYENLKEALMRLLNTVVMYDGEPWYIHAITDHKKDNIFRVYMSPTDHASNIPDILSLHGSEHPNIGEMLDKWLEGNKDSKIVRKQMNSPLFNKFRPFPLGMCNTGGHCYYIERSPNRKSEQGLIRSMLSVNLVSLDEGKSMSPGAYTGAIGMFNEDFKNCILGAYPSPQVCLNGLKNPEYSNTAVGFNRKFALAKGPIGMIFLAYKSDIIGVLPRGDFSQVIIGEKFIHTKEVVSELGLFADIVC